MAKAAQCFETYFLFYFLIRIFIYSFLNPGVRGFTVKIYTVWTKAVKATVAVFVYTLTFKTMFK